MPQASQTRHVRARSLLGTASAGLALAVALGITPAHAQAPACASAGPEGPMTVTPDCEDPVYNARTFVIDKVSQVTAPLPHTRVDAHFTPPAGKDTYKVTLYLAPRETWEGRFFQLAYPLEQPENLDIVAFGLRHGAYLVNVAGVPCGCGGYRPDAAAAKLARLYAQDFYKTDRRIYGYVFGGSGGGLLTAGAAEHTEGVWDGIMPVVMPNPASLANVNAMSALASLVLNPKLADIADAVSPGSNRDPFDGLNPEQRATLTESLALGTPRATFGIPDPFSRMGVNPLLVVLTGGVKENDPGYTADFWSKPGYEGANPPPYLKAAIREEWATVTAVERDDKGQVLSVKLDRVPNIGHPMAGISFEYWLYGPDGKAKLGELGGQLAGDTIFVRRNGSGKTGELGQGIEALMKRAVIGAAEQVSVGQKINVNNLNYLALHYYHRHAMPLDRDFYTYDQYRKADGTPIYPQRAYLASPESAKGTAGGGLQTGRITGKTMVVQSMNDTGAQPWMADWLARRVRTKMGEKGYADNFRIYLNDNAGHFGVAPGDPIGATTVSYVPGLNQSLLDLAAWVERGVAPPVSSNYTVTNGQVALAPEAAKRGGIQPVVDLTVNGSDRIEVTVNQPVTFKGRVEVPPHAGKVTSMAWWFGEGEFALTPQPLAKPAAHTEVTATHAFAKPGTYFVTFRATSQRDGKPGDPDTQVQNLDRVRVVVR